jgi:hypothetical protein
MGIIAPGLAVLAAGFLGYVLIKGENPDTKKKEGKSNPVAEVELDLFSGRPNPVWKLEPALCEDLEQRISRLPMAPSFREEATDRLGYRGFRIGLPSESAKGADSLYIFGGRVTRINGSDRSQYLDADKQIELWLLSTSARAEPALDKNLLEQLVIEIGAGQ